MTLFIAFSMSSCKKNEGNNTEDLKEYARVNLEFLTDQGNPVSARLKSFAATTASIENPFASQHVSIPLDEGTILSATLEYVEPERDLSSSLKASALASTGPLKQASVVNSPLVAGIKYRLVAYTADGDYVKDLVFTSGDESETNFTLDAGEEYHFVCYSVNSTSFVPECDKNNLFTAKLETALSANNSLLFYRSASAQEMAYGNNTVQITLKQKEARITTIIDASQIGSISAISGVTFSPNYSAVNIDFGSGNMSYIGSMTNTPVSFPNVGVPQITSLPFAIHNSVETTGALTIGSMTIGADTKGPLVISGLKVVPGARYNLRITVNKIIVIDDVEWMVGNLKYDPVSGEYSVGQPWESGQYFQWNALIPLDLFPSGDFSGDRYVFDNDRDPCRKLAGNWKTPSVVEAETIFEDAVCGMYGNTGIRGYYVGPIKMSVRMRFIGRIHTRGIQQREGIMRYFLSFLMFHQRQGKKLLLRHKALVRHLLILYAV
jgi:hypothetical protein